MINHRYNIYKKTSQGAKPRSRACVYIIEFLLIQAAYVERMPQADRAGVVVEVVGAGEGTLALYSELQLRE